MREGQLSLLRQNMLLAEEGAELMEEAGRQGWGFSGIRIVWEVPGSGAIVTGRRGPKCARKAPGRAGDFLMEEMAPDDDF